MFTVSATVHEILTVEICLIFTLIFRMSQDEM